MPKEKKQPKKVEETKLAHISDPEERAERDAGQVEPEKKE